MKNLALYSSISLLSLLLGFSYRFHLPQVKEWALSSLKIYSYNKLPVIVEAEDISFHLLPLHIELSNIKIRGNKAKAPQLKKFIAKTIKVYPDLFALSLGSAKVSEVGIDQVRLVVVIPRSKASSKSKDASPQIPTEKNLAEIFNRLPIDKISITNLNYFARYQGPKLSNLLTGASLNLTKFNTNLFLDFDFPSFKLKETNNDKSFLDFSISSKLALTPSKIRLESLKVYEGDSFLDLQARADSWLSDKERSFGAELSSRIDLARVRKLSLRFQPNLKIPELLGTLSTKLSLDSTDIKRLKGSLDFSNLSIEKYMVGDLTTELDAGLEKISLNNLEIKHKRNHIAIASLLLEKKVNQWLINLNPKVKSLELRQLLNDIQVGDTPLRLDLNSDQLACAGKISPEFSLLCKGDIQAPFFRVFVSDTNQTIHSFKNAQISGEVLINEKGVYPKADIKMGDSNGKASGFIEYANGFSIDYESDNLNFKNIESLVDLPLEGGVKLKGNTKGGTQFATIDMQIQSSALRLFKYNLGNVNTSLKYRSGILSFSEVKARLGQSTVSGGLSIDLSKNSISGKLRGPGASLEDIQFLVKDNLSLPVDIKGSGDLFLSFGGPLEFNKLDYNLIYKASAIKVASENLDRLEVDLVARRGMLTSRKLSALKAGVPVKGSIQMDPRYRLEIELETNSLPIESITFAERFGTQVSGKLNAKIKTTGVVPQLGYDIQSEIVDLSMGGVDLQNSDIDYSYLQGSHKVEANIFGKTMTVSSELPALNSGLPFYLKAKAEDFNFTALFSLLGLNTSQTGFQSKMSGDIDLKSLKGGLWASSGKIGISKLSLSRGPLSLEAGQALVIRANKGFFSSEKWSLTGDGTDLVYQVKPTRGGELNSSMEGNINLALISFTLPFLNDLRGDLSLSTQITGKLTKPVVTGSALLKNTQFRIPGFPHPFERINSDIIFNNNNIVVNKVESDLAGGKLLASGNVEFRDFTDIPTKITGTITNSKLEFIEGLELVSSGDFELSGSWFPFLLTAQARVTEGTISPKTSTDQAQKVRPSRYLPKVLLKDSFDPLVLNIQASISDKVLINVPEIKTNIRGNMNITGPMGAMVYDGDINFVPGGTLFFRDTPFNISTGSINFAKITELNPQLFVDAQTSITEQSSQTNYDVSLQLEGSLESFTTNLDSQPSLPRADLISLLALGLTSSQLDQQSVENQRDLQMMELGAAVISNSPLGKEIEDRTGFTFKLSTDIDETDSTELKVVISKQVTPKIGASASVLGNNSKKDVKVEYKLNTGLSLIGSWESTTFEEDGGSTADQNQQSDIFGLDLRYKVEFR